MPDLLKTSGLQLSQLGVIAGAIILSAYYLRKKDTLPLPPGPSRLPLLGSAHHIPGEEKWSVFAEWRKQYGDIVYIDALGTPIIILNSAKAAIDLLDKRGSIYAGRPVLQLAGEMVGWKDAIPFCAYDQRHRESRKLLFGYLAPRKIATKHQILEQKTVEYLLDPLLIAPDKFMDHVRKTVAAPLFLLSHGHIVAKWPDSDPLVDLAQTAVDEFGEAVEPGKYLVDLFPILRFAPDWFPGTEWKRTMRRWRARAVQLRDDAYLHVKEQVRSNTALPSFTAELVEKNKNPTLKEEMLYRWASVAFYSAGADTTVSSIASFILMMLIHPEVQREAQAEIDRVVSRERLPSFSDREHLPYLEGIIKEIYRTCPVVPLSIPHCALEEDTYEGYRMPKGAIVMPNIWAMLHDPTIYPSPFEFQPNRYTSSSSPSSLENDLSDTAAADIEGKIAVDKENNDASKLGLNPDPAKFFFGFGRRVCPGQFLADASVWIAASMLLSSFDISPTIGLDGTPHIPEVKFTSSTISHPTDFQCVIKPRYPEAVDLIRNCISSYSASN